MNKIQIIDEYLYGLKTSNNLSTEQVNILRRLFMLLYQKDDAQFIKEASGLMAYCNEEFSKRTQFEPKLAKIATKVFQMMIEK